MGLKKLQEKIVNILTRTRINVKFSAMYKQPNPKRHFHQHFFGMGVFIF